MIERGHGAEFEEIHFELGRLSLWIFLLSLPLLCASVFSYPFPFLRHIWMKENFGLTGLLNALLLVWISQQIKSMHLPPVAAGIGLFVNEQIVTLRGFLFLHSMGRAETKDILFLALSIIAGLIFFGLLLRSAIAIIWYKKWYYREGPGTGEKKTQPNLTPLIINFFIYAFLLTGIHYSKELAPPVLAAALKGISLLAAFAAFLGTGYEIQFYLRRAQNVPVSVLKSMLHLAALAAVLWISYQRLPVESMLTA